MQAARPTSDTLIRSGVLAPTLFRVNGEKDHGGTF